MPEVGDIGIREFAGDGDLRSAECIELLKQADIVVTHPPFSLFREYVAQLVQYGKKFLIVGSQNAVTYKEIFPLIKDGAMWLGTTPKGQDMRFDVPEGYAQELVATAEERSAYRVVEGVIKGRLGNAAWFTNLDHANRHEELILYKRYSPEEYPTDDNYDAINVDRIAEIPMDWEGAMGVPITLLDKHNPEQFEILGFSSLWDDGFESHTCYDKHAELRADGTKTGMSRVPVPADRVPAVGLAPLPHPPGQLDGTSPGNRHSPGPGNASSDRRFRTSTR